MKGWKVVYENSIGDYESFARFVGSGGVIYKFDKPTVPECGNGPLCVFKTKRHAKDFARSSGRGNLIFPCTYVPSVFHTVWVNDSPSMPIENLARGTILADEVTILSVSDEIITKEALR
jgi:hypothetical protein